MKIRLSVRAPVARDRVFSALVDPEILRRCIPGCEELTPENPENPANPANPVTYIVKLKVGVAGLKGSYTGRVRIRDQRPPDALALGFEGQGAPGFVRGEAIITLRGGAPGGSTAGTLETEIACEADVQVGGLIAAVGSRLVEATAKKLADDFFRKLSEELSHPENNPSS